jgi:hypothetical protein
LAATAAAAAALLPTVDRVAHDEEFIEVDKRTAARCARVAYMNAVCLCEYFGVVDQ